MTGASHQLAEGRLMREKGDKPPPLRKPSASGESVAPAQRRGETKAELPGKGIILDSPEAILKLGDVIQAAINSQPALSALLFVNPAAVLEDLGFEMTAEVRGHILHALGHGRVMGEEMESLQKRLIAGLGEEGQKLNFANPSHTARILFNLLKLQPLDTQHVQAPTRPAPQSGRIERLGQVPQPRRKLSRPSARPVHAMSIAYPSYRAQFRVLDVEARLPELPVAAAAPERLSTEELLFYRDKHPLVPLLLRFQVLHHSQLPFRSAATYRDIRDGKQPNIFRSWIKAVFYPPRGVR
jgi:hypothetical protein